MTPTKEPSKDFRESVSDIIDAVYVHGVREGDAPGSRTGKLPKDEMNISDGIASILAICKEMLVEGRREPRWSVGKDLNEGWNAYNDSLLKQLGEK